MPVTAIAPVTVRSAKPKHILTERQIELFRDLRAIDAAYAEGYRLPPQPFMAHAGYPHPEMVGTTGQGRYVPPSAAPAPHPFVVPSRALLSQPRPDNLPRNPGERDTDYTLRNDANIARQKREASAVPANTAPFGQPMLGNPNALGAPTPFGNALARIPGETDAAYAARVSPGSSNNLPRNPGETDADYNARRDSGAGQPRQWTDPSPGSEAQRAADEVKARALGVNYAPRMSGETDAAFDARQASSPKINP